jgi:hypothetical protein
MQLNNIAHGHEQMERMFSINASVPPVVMKANNSPLALFFADIRNVSVWKSATCQSYLFLVYLITLSVNSSYRVSNDRILNKKLNWKGSGLTSSDLLRPLLRGNWKNTKDFSRNSQSQSWNLSHDLPEYEAGMIYFDPTLGDLHGQTIYLN